MKPSLPPLGTRTGRRKLIGGGARTHGADRTPSMRSKELAQRLASGKPRPGFGRRPRLAVIALNRMAFGPRPGDLEAFDALGSDDRQRLENYVEQQLDPASIDDGDLEARLQQSGFQTLNKPLNQLWREHVREAPNHRARTLPRRETERATFTRAIFSRRQLHEVITEFWHTHFNVFAHEYQISPVWVHYDRDVIRANALGNFRSLLEAVASSPAMLFYLDNFTNSNAGPNENFARELFELHTMGAESYLGVGRQLDVSRDENGKPIGYVDDDVYEATRCFTGWTVDEETGGLFYRSDWHDRFQKTVLGEFFPPDQPPLRDGRIVLDQLAFHPGTARHIARRLCSRLIADEPPTAAVEVAARVFQQEKDSPDQLAKVVRSILLSEDFRRTWGRKIKRPFELIVSCLRAAQSDFLFKLEDRYVEDFMYLHSRTQHGLFAWRTPDGYPDAKEPWLSSGPLINCWRFINWLFTREIDDAYPVDAFSQTPSQLRSANELADYWIERMLGRPMDAQDRREIVDFMAQGRDPEIDLRLDISDDARHRLRMMVALIALSPDFHWR